MEKKRTFIYPDAIILEFNHEDVILTSDVGDWYGETEGDDWIDED